MEITCLQMDVLISFYLENELSAQLKQKVEEHLEKCSACRAKYKILSSIFSELRTIPQKTTVYSTSVHPGRQYVLFKNNLSAYIDNELPEEENLKMKKFTINNKNARKELENTFHIRKLMKDSFRNTKINSKHDFSKKVLKQLNLEDKTSLAFNPLIKVGFAFIMSVLLISAVVIYILSL